MFPYSQNIFYDKVNARDDKCYAHNDKLNACDDKLSSHGDKVNARSDKFYALYCITHVKLELAT